MTIGSFTDKNENTIEVGLSSDVEGGMWLRIRPPERSDDRREAAGHLSVSDARVLIALLKKAIKAEEAD